MGNSGAFAEEFPGIDYNWGELHLYSQTSYALRENRLNMDLLSSPEVVPDDIAVNDTVIFVWEINHDVQFS